MESMNSGTQQRFDAEYDPSGVYELDMFFILAHCLVLLVENDVYMPLEGK